VTDHRTNEGRPTGLRGGCRIERRSSELRAAKGSHAPDTSEQRLEELEGMAGIDVNAAEDEGGVTLRDSSSMGGRLPRGLPHLAAGCETSESGYESALRKDVRGQWGASPAELSSRAESSSRAAALAVL
jgi:hypothetical protein